MTVELTVHDIGRAGDPSATTRSTHVDTARALSTLVAMFHPDSIRGTKTDGTVGSMTGNVFQASWVWSIREVEDEQS